MQLIFNQPKKAMKLSEYTVRILGQAVLDDFLKNSETTLEQYSFPIQVDQNRYHIKAKPKQLPQTKNVNDWDVEIEKKYIVT